MSVDNVGKDLYAAAGPEFMKMRDDLATVESALNILDDTIVFTPLSVTVRVVMAIVVGAGSLGLAAKFYNESRSADGAKRAALQDKTWACIDLTRHSALNYGRAQVAATFIIGSIALAIYDFGLNQREKYVGEKENPIQATIVDSYNEYAPQAKKMAEPHVAALKAKYEALVAHEV